jgi:predicted phage-related endonuclease
MFDIICTSTADRDRWLAERRKGLGSTVAPQLLGVHRFGSLLGTYLYLRGEGAPQEQNEYMLWGRDKQRAVMEHIGKRLGLWTRESEELIRSHARPWQLATLDAWTIAMTDAEADEECEVVRAVQWIRERQHPFEIKVVMSPTVAAKWKDGAPPDVIAQVQWQLAITGCDRALVAAELCGAPPVYEWLDRDDDMIAELNAKGAAFWADVQEGRPPEPDGSEACDKAIEAAAKKREGTAQLPIECVVATEEIAELSRSITELTREKKRLTQGIRLAMGKALTGELPGDAGRWITVKKPSGGFVKVTPLSGNVGMMHVAQKLEGLDVKVEDVPATESSHIRRGK